MITLSLDAPLASLLEAARADGRVDSLTALAKLASRTEETFHDARRLGARVKLSTLARYARAVGWTLVIEVHGRPLTDQVLGGVIIHKAYVADELDLSVGSVRALLEALDLTPMVLTLGPAERSGP